MAKRALPLPFRTPLRYPRYSLLGDIGEQRAQAEANIFDQRLAKLKLLAAHYGIDDTQNHWPVLLAMRLAIEHYPGFRINSSTDRAPHRPRKFDHGDMLRILLRVELLKLDNPKLSDAKACEIVVGDDDKSLVGASHKTERLARAKDLTRYLAPARKTAGGSAIKKMVAMANSPKK